MFIQHKTGPPEPENRHLILVAEPRHSGQLPPTGDDVRIRKG